MLLLLLIMALVGACGPWLVLLAGLLLACGSTCSTGTEHTILKLTCC